MSTIRLVRALDLKNDADLITAYEGWHNPGAVWSPVVAHIYAQGVLDMEIWRVDDRLMMIMEVTQDFPRPVEEPPLVAEWEALMGRFQHKLPSSDADEKWKPMKRIFSLGEQEGEADA